MEGGNKVLRGKKLGIRVTFFIGTFLTAAAFVLCLVGRGLEGHSPDTAVLTSSSPMPPPGTAADAVRHVPRSVVDKWIGSDYLIVFGVPSEDVEGRRRRRNLQRSTCWRFPGVATGANNFTGDMLVLYVLARHPSHNYTYSAALLEEAAQWNDVVVLPMNEGRPSTNKTIGSDGTWGVAAEVGMSRKTFMWYHVALYLFPQANYIAKGDDDMFLRVPQYLADLRTLPRRGVYWGFFDISRRMKVRYATGYSVTLARDVAEQVVSYEPIINLVYHPHKANESDFLNMNMEHEDVMVGRALKERRYPHLVYAREKPCRFHDVHVGLSVQPVTSRSVVIHHIKESEYAELMERFGNDTSPTGKRYRWGSRHFIGFRCDP